MKLTHPFLVIAILAVSASIAGSAVASGCPDDPEHCVERGATVTHRSVAVSPTTVASSASAHMAPAIASRKVWTTAAAPPPSAAAHKPSSKPARITPATPAPPTPGMGMLLKLSNGSGGEVSLFPSKPADNTTGASWVL